MRWSMSDTLKGSVDMAACVRAYRQAGYDGVLCPDHVPFFDVDPGRERFFALCLGYKGCCRPRDALPLAMALYGASRVHIERVETMAASHEETVSVAGAEAQIGAPL